MNPYTIGEHLFVHFGNRQRWQVAALSNERCAMRMPGLTHTAVLWFSLDSLRKWNPDREPTTIVPVQFPAVVPGLRIQRAGFMSPGGMIYPDVDYTVVCVLHGVAYVRHHTPELAGAIIDHTLRYFWQTSHPAPLHIRYEAVTLQGHELRTIAAIHRARRAGQNYHMNRLNAGLDTIPARVWERLHIEREYRITRRKLDAGLKVSA